MPEFNEYRYSALEYREEAAESEDFLGVTLGGPVLNYGDIAQLPWGKERFEPGAFRRCFQVDCSGQPDASTGNASRCDRGEPSLH